MGKKARLEYEEKGDFRSFFQFYYATAKDPIDLYNGGEFDDKVPAEEVVKDLEKYKIDTALLTKLTDTFGADDGLEVSDTSGMMLFLIGQARENTKTFKDDMSEADLKKHQKRFLDTALQLLDLDDGNNEFIQKYSITGMGNLPKEKRDELRADILAEKQRLGLQ